MDTPFDDPDEQVGLPPEGTVVSVALWGLAVASGMAWLSIGGIRWTDTGTVG